MKKSSVLIIVNLFIIALAFGLFTDYRNILCDSYSNKVLVCSEKVISSGVDVASGGKDVDVKKYFHETHSLFFDVESFFGELEVGAEFVLFAGYHEVPILPP